MTSVWHYSCYWLTAHRRKLLNVVFVLVVAAVDCMQRRITRCYILFQFWFLKINKNVNSFLRLCIAFLFHSCLENSGFFVFVFITTYTSTLQKKKRLLLTLICIYDKHVRARITVRWALCVCACVMHKSSIWLRLLKIIHVRSRSFLKSQHACALNGEWMAG